MFERANSVAPDDVPNRSFVGQVYSAVPGQTFPALAGDPPAMPSIFHRLFLNFAAAPTNTLEVNYLLSRWEIPRTGVYAIDLVADMAHPGGAASVPCYGYYSKNNVQVAVMAMTISNGFGGLLFPWSIIDSFEEGDLIDFRFAGSNSQDVNVRAFTVTFEEIL